MLYEGENAGVEQNNTREQQLAQDAGEIGHDILKNSKDLAKNAKAAEETAKTGAEAAKNGFQAGEAVKDGVQTGAEAAKTGAEAAKAGAEAAKTVKDGAEAAAEIAKTSAEIGADAAAGAATMGAWIAAKAAMKLTKYVVNKVNDEIKSIGDKGTIEDDYKLNHPLLFTLIIVPTLFIIFSSVLVGKLTPGSNENYQETSFSQELNEDQVALVEREFSDEEIDKLDEESPLRPGAATYIYGEDDEGGFRNALHDAITDMCYHWVAYLGEKRIKTSDLTFKWTGPDHGIKGFNYEKTLRLFYENEWPYALRESSINNKFPLVGNVCAAAGCECAEDYEPFDDKDRLYNDVNFAEVLTILSQNPDYNWRNCKLDEYNEYIRRDETLQNYFELAVKWIVVYTGTKNVQLNVTNTGPVNTSIEVSVEIPFETEEEVCASPNSVMHDGVVCDRDYYYCRTIVKPFGLSDLYAIADVNPSPKIINSTTKVASTDENEQRRSGYNVDFYSHYNIDLLDRSEYMERTFLRKEAKMVGPDYRDDRDFLSTVYYDTRTDWDIYSLTGTNGWDQREEDNWVGKDKYPKGRSGTYYIPWDKQYVLDEYAKKGFKEIRKEWEDEEKKEGLDAQKLEAILEDIDDPVVRDFIEQLVKIAYDDRYTYDDSTEGRNSEFSFDCSSFVARIAAKIGNDIFGGKSLNSDSQYVTCKNAGLLTNVLKPGSIIYYGGGTVDQGHPNGIHHVAVYIGNGQIVHASGRWLDKKRNIPKPAADQICVRNWIEGYDNAPGNYYANIW